MQLMSTRTAPGVRPVSAKTARARHTLGFSLIEVLVALLIISIGLLGIAKMQALALSNTAGARVRALAAIEADSLAATLETDRSYWASLTANLTVTVTTRSSGAPTITASPADSSLTTTINCLSGTGTNAPCTAHKMAGYDLQQWATYLQDVMGGANGGNAFASLICTPPAGTTPTTCTISIQWAEQAVAANGAETSGSSTALTTATYTLVVNP
jgi:type IV pilus assembly protein PilV